VLDGVVDGRCGATGADWGAGMAALQLMGAASGGVPRRGFAFETKAAEEAAEQATQRTRDFAIIGASTPLSPCHSLRSTGRRWGGGVQ